jgi:hypothetical protein
MMEAVSIFLKSVWFYALKFLNLSHDAELFRCLFMEAAHTSETSVDI